VPIRGNIDTRMRKVTDGELDAVVLARAGLARIGLVEAITETLDPIQMLPSPAQGALAVECRTADGDLEQLLRSTLDDEGTRAAVTAERSLMAALEAGCSAPVGALAEIVEDLDADGKVVERISLRGTAAAEGENGAVDMVRAIALADKDQAAQLGKDLAAELLDLGAGAFSGPAQ